MNNKKQTFNKVLEEVNQGHSTRKILYRALEETLKKVLGRDVKIVSFFTSFTYPVLIQDNDADMLEEVLSNSDLSSKELILVLNSPGGDALTAERIVNVCRSFSSNGGFSVIVPKMAKSAATMVCLGAKKIYMSKTSELGPIDPQILIYDDQGRPNRYQAAHEVIESYNDLLAKANTTKGRVEPYLQQLARFDARDIRGILSSQQLSESIAITLLKGGVMAKKTEKEIEKCIRPFLDPKHTKVHGRPIYSDIAIKCSLPIECVENTAEHWQSVWDLYVRMNYVVSNLFAKVVESAEESYVASPLSKPRLAG